MPKQVAVAWSGGADSTMLLLLLKDLGFDVQAWHIDHGWHAQSFQLTTVLSKQAAQWAIDFHVKHLEKPKQNIESEARQGRYAAFADLAKEQSCYHVALGHHADDQAETVCMRLLQGAGVAGCQGIRMHREQSGLHFWRPLLDVSRHSIEAELKARGIPWTKDPSNEDESLWRNKIRHSLFPKMASHAINPQQLFLRWQKQACEVQQKIVDLAQGIMIKKYKDGESIFCEMDWLMWCEQISPVRVYLLQNMVGLLFNDGTVFGRRHILAIEQWREHGGNGWLNLSGCCLYRQGQGLQLCQGKTSLRDNKKNKCKTRLEVKDE